MRALALLAIVVLLSGCATSVESSQKPTPKPTAIQKWAHAPRMTLNKADHYSATLVTSDGTLQVTLYPSVAPITVNNFVFLARHHFYDGVIFHRIVPNFVVQTGDPTGTGSGGPGYTFPNEPVSMPYTFGTLAMANSGLNTNGSQFFIVTGKRIKLPPEYTIFGKVTGGIAALGRLNKTPVTVNPGSGEQSYPVNPPVLKKVIIHQTP